MSQFLLNVVFTSGITNAHQRESTQGCSLLFEIEANQCHKGSEIQRREGEIKAISIWLRVPVFSVTNTGELVPILHLSELCWPCSTPVVTALI